MSIRKRETIIQELDELRKKQKLLERELTEDIDSSLVRWQKKLSKVKSIATGRYRLSICSFALAQAPIETKESTEKTRSKDLSDPSTGDWSYNVYKAISKNQLYCTYRADSVEELMPETEEDLSIIKRYGVQFTIENMDGIQQCEDSINLLRDALSEAGKLLVTNNIPRRVSCVIDYSDLDRYYRYHSEWRKQLTDDHKQQTDVIFEELVSKGNERKSERKQENMNIINVIDGKISNIVNRWNVCKEQLQAQCI